MQKKIIHYICSIDKTGNEDYIYQQLISIQNYISNERFCDRDYNMILLGDGVAE